MNPESLVGWFPLCYKCESLASSLISLSHKEAPYETVVWRGLKAKEKPVIYLHIENDEGE